MITTGPHPRTSTSDRARSIGAAKPASASVTAAEISATRSHLSIIADVTCAVLFLAVAVSAALPLVWGLALHQTPLAISGGCGEAMCVIALLNRIFAPVAARKRFVPFLAALEERQWILVLFLALMATSAATLISNWPGNSG